MSELSVFLTAGVFLAGSALGYIGGRLHHRPSRTDDGYIQSEYRCPWCHQIGVRSIEGDRCTDCAERLRKSNQRADRQERRRKEAIRQAMAEARADGCDTGWINLS